MFFLVKQKIVFVDHRMVRFDEEENIKSESLTNGELTEISVLNAKVNYIKEN